VELVLNLKIINVYQLKEYKLDQMKRGTTPTSVDTIDGATK